jgi:hypothetical protein
MDMKGERMSKGPKHTDHVVESLRNSRQHISNKCMKGADPDKNTEAHLCSRIDGVMHCSVYAFPEAMWRNGDCLMADEQLRTDTAPRTKHGKIRVGQQKSYRRKRSRR